MSAWWWLPIGMAAWFAAGVPVALLIGPVLRRRSDELEEA